MLEVVADGERGGFRNRLQDGMMTDTGIPHALMGIIVAVTLLLGCCGIGRCQTRFFTKDDIPPIDDVNIVELFQKSVETHNPKLWEDSLSTLEKIEMPVVAGFAIAHGLKGQILDKKDSYGKILSAIDLIKSGIDFIESTDIRQLLYLNSREAGLFPVRFYYASALECGLKFEEADSAYIKMTEDVGRDFGTDSDEFVFWTNMASAAINSRYKNYEKALELMAPALDAALNSDKVAKNTSFGFLVSYARKNNRAGHFDEALRTALIALPRAEGHEQTYEIHRLLGELYASAGKIDDAEKHFTTAAGNSPSLPDYLANSYAYANFLKNTGRGEDGVAILRELNKYIDSEELGDIDRFNYYENLGVATTFSAPDESKAAFDKAKQYIEGVGYDVLIRHIFNSEIYPNEGNTFLQISALDRCMFIYHYFIKNEPRLQAEILYLLGNYYLKIRDYDKAANYLVEAFGNTLDYADSDPFTLRIVQDLCSVYKTTGQNGLWKVAIDELIRTAEPLGRDSDRYLDAIASALDYALTTNNLTEAEEYLTIYCAGRPDDFDATCFRIRLAIARQQFDDAKTLLTVLEKEKSDDTPDLSDLWQDLYSSMRHPDVAIYARRIFENYRDEILQQLLFMSGEERNNLKDELTRRRDNAIAMIEHAPDIVDVAFDYSLLIKGLLLNTQSSLNKYLSTKPEAVEDWDKLQTLRHELSRAEFQGDDAECKSLRGAISSRERYILSDYVDYDIFKKTFNKRMASAVKSDRPAGSVLVDFVRYSAGAASSYGAFIVDVNGNSHFVRISSASKLERMPFGAWIELDDYLKDAEAVYFCPDGKLSTLPLEFQHDGDGKQYGDRYKIHRVFHLADLPTDDAVGDTPVAVGVSDHNSPVGKAETIDRGNWVDIPSVKEEISQFQQIFAKKNPVVLFNDQATEDRVKALSGTDVSILHISTHGFYRDRDSLLTASRDEGHPDCNIAQRALKVGKNELSGLVLRRGNLSWKSPDITDLEDDLLTAEEIEQMSFPNLKLTVLSACNTGIGNTDSDGVWGLQRAFRIAGSRSLICSLQKVDDYWTAQFMEELYKNAADGISIYDSFHSARKTLWETPECPRELLSSFILIE